MKSNKTDKIASRRSLLKRMHNYRLVYLMFLPVFVLTLILCYFPMAGILYSFTNYKLVRAPEWIGLDNFTRMFSMTNFWRAFNNTLVLSITKLILNTGCAVLVSLLLNEIVNLKFKKITQTIIYLPHFLSWVVTASIFGMILSPSQSGLVNSLLVSLGIIEQGKEIYFMGNQEWWRPVYYLINIWKEIGWGTIIFLATLSSVNPELYESASIDGASRLKRMRYITLPALSSTIIIVLILNLAKIMNLFESVYVLMNDAVVSKADVIQTYIYSQTFNSGTIPNYGYTTAVGLFNSLVACVLVLVCNFISKKVRGSGIV